jgi:prepilin peptidase CpaA
MVFSHFVLALLSGLLALCAAVIYTDFKYRRIPNKYLLIASCYALMIFAAMFITLPETSKVARGLFMCLLGSLLGGLFLYPPYKLKQVGAGDVKLAMVFGLFLSMKGVILSILIGAMIGGVWALGLAWKHGGLAHMWYNMKYMAKSVYLSGFKDMGWDLKSEGAVTMPYGVALCLGAIIIAVEQMFVHYHKLLALYAGS